MESPEQSHDNSNIYIENNEYNYDNNMPIDMSMRLPAKMHISKLEEILTNLNYDLEESKKNIQKLRGEVLYLGFQNNENDNEMTNYIVNEAIKLTNSFRNLTQEELEDNNSIKSQIQNLKEERMKLQQETLVLESRIFEAEKDLGYKFI